MNVREADNACQSADGFLVKACLAGERHVGGAVLLIAQRGEVDLCDEGCQLYFVFQDSIGRHSVDEESDRRRHRPTSASATTAIRLRSGIAPNSGALSIPVDEHYKRNQSMVNQYIDPCSLYTVYTPLLSSHPSCLPQPSLFDGESSLPEPSPSTSQRFVDVLLSRVVVLISVLFQDLILDPSKYVDHHSFLFTSSDTPDVQA